MPLGYAYTMGHSKWLNLSRLTDSQVVWLYNETGERGYYSELFLRYLPLIYGTALKYIPGEEQAKEVVKRLYDVVLEKFDKTDFYGNVFRDWLYVNVVRFLEDYVKENRIEERHFFSRGIQNTLTENAFRYAAILENGGHQAEDLLHRYSDGLTKAELTCIEMFFVKRKSFRSIASSTGYLVGAVKKYIESGLEKMAAFEIPERPLEMVTE